MSTLVRADGVLLEQVRAAAAIAAAPGALGPVASAQLERAQSRTAWGRSSRHRLVLVEGRTVLASAEQHDLAGVLDGTHVRVCGIGSVFSAASDRRADHVRTLIDRIVAQAAEAGVDLVAMFAPLDAIGDDTPAGFEAIPRTELTLEVAKPVRYGAPMTMVRTGGERDLQAIAAMGRQLASPYRFHLDRDVDFIQYAITTRRLFAGLGPAHERQLQFFIAEEGTTAAAYVVMSVTGATWTLEECGDRDPSGARVGALLQALIAREPAEQRPTIRGWLPSGFLPPQVTISARTVAPEQLWVCSLRPSTPWLALGDSDVLYWRNDVF